MAIPKAKTVEQATVLSPANDPSSEIEKNECLAPDDALAEYDADKPAVPDIATCDLPWLDDQVTFHLFSNRSDTDVSKPITATYRELMADVFGKHRGQTDKDGPCVIGSEFLSPAGGRKDANVKSVSFIQLDFDNSKIEGRQTKPGDIGEVWMKRRCFGGYIYSTFSHSGALTKFRVVLPLKQPFHIRDSIDDPNGAVRVALFKRALKHLADDTGEPYDVSCVNPARLFYTPAYNLNDPEAEGLCHCEFVAGDAVDFDKLAEELPPERETKINPKSAIGRMRASKVKTPEEIAHEKEAAETAEREREDAKIRLSGLLEGLAKDSGETEIETVLQTLLETGPTGTTVDICVNTLNKKTGVGKKTLRDLYEALAHKARKAAPTPEPIEPKPDLQTQGLLKFLALWGEHFEIENFLQDKNWRDKGRSTTGTTFECPNADAHTPKPGDDDWRFGFWAENASERDGGFGCACSHTSCKEACMECTGKENDRAWFLDIACVQSGIEHAKELLAWCPGHESDDWETQSEKDAAISFRRDSFNNIVANDAVNARLALEALGYTFSENQFSHKIYVKTEHSDDAANKGKASVDYDLKDAAFKINKRFFFNPTNDALERAIVVMARENAWHPVQDYLNGLVWDGVPRVAKWSHTYMRAEDTPLHSEFGKRWLLAGVARIFKPGTKFDQCLVFEGAQGSGKSTAFRVLAVKDEWFTDSVPIDADGKVTMEQTAGKWIVELAELAGMSGAAVEKVKVQMSRTSDLGRKAYGRIAEEIPRQFIFGGTTNSKQYLKDRTGSRRFWGEKVGKTDEAALRADVDQLWAEAVAMYRAGETCQLPPEFYSVAAEAQKVREVANPYTERLSDQLGEFEAGYISSGCAYRIAGLSDHETNGYKLQDVREAMETLGWAKQKVTIDDKRVWGFVVGENGPLIIASDDGKAIAESPFSQALRR